MRFRVQGARSSRVQGVHLETRECSPSRGATPVLRRVASTRFFSRPRALLAYNDSPSTQRRFSPAPRATRSLPANPPPPLQPSSLRECPPLLKSGAKISRRLTAGHYTQQKERSARPGGREWGVHLTCLTLAPSLRIVSLLLQIAPSRSPPSRHVWRFFAMVCSDKAVGTRGGGDHPPFR